MARQTQLERNAILESKIAHLESFTARMELDHAAAMNTATREHQSEVRELKAQITTAEKALADSKSTRDYYSRLADETSKELSALHTILDFLPGAPPRKTLDPEYGSQQPVPLVARFAAFLATKS